MIDKNTADVRVWMPPELKLLLQRLADEDERPLSDYLRIVLRSHVRSMDPDVNPLQANSSGQVGTNVHPFDSERMAGER